MVATKTGVWTLNKTRVICILGALAVIFVVFGFSYVSSAEKFPIKHVRVEGDYTHEDPNQIKSLVTPLVAQGLFSVNLGAIQTELQQLPWVQSAVVSRVWPDEILITLTEKMPLARTAKNGVLTQTGDLFFPAANQIPNDLPLFEGEAANYKMMAEAYQHFSAILAPLDLHILELRLTSGMIWRVRLSNGMTVTIGGEEMDARLQRFSQVYSKLFANRIASSVDLRYQQGLAIKW